MSEFAIISDSSCDLPEAYVKQYGVDVYPMLYTLEGKEYQEDYWTSLSSKDFYDALRGGKASTTSQISLGDMIQVLTECCKRGQDVVFITLSSGISGTYESASSAAREVGEQYPERKLCVVDSIAATMSHSLLLMMADQKRKEGLSAEDTAAFLNEKRHSVFAFFTVDDLMFLHRGGRVSKLSAIAGGLLGVKPLLWVNPAGFLKLRGKVRGRKASLDALFQNMKDSVKPGSHLTKVSIIHGDALEDAEYLATLVKQAYAVDEMIVTILGPVISSHSGPGTIALFFEGDITREEYASNH